MAALWEEILIFSIDNGFGENKDWYSVFLYLLYVICIFEKVIDLYLPLKDYQAKTFPLYVLHSRYLCVQIAILATAPANIEALHV